MEIILVKRQKRNEFLVNEQELTFYWSEKKIDDLEVLLSSLISAVSTKNYPMVSSLLINNRDKNLTNLLIALEKLCKNDYVNFIYSICDLFVSKVECLTVASIFNYMMWNFEDLRDNWNRKSTPHYLSRINFKDIVSSYIDKKVINKIKIGLTTTDKNLVWTTIPCIQRPYLFNKLNSELLNEFEYFVRECGKEYISKNETISYVKFINYCLTGQGIYEYSSLIAKYLRIESVLKKVYKKSQEQHHLKRVEKYNFEDNEWLISGGKNVQSQRTVNLVFSEIKTELRNDVKQYIEFLLNTSINRKSIQSKLTNIKAVLQELETLKYNEINTLSKINFYHVQHLVNHLQQLRKPDNTRKYSMGTIIIFFTTMRHFIDWFIIDSSVKMNNPFRKYKFRNASSFSTPTEYIPEEVIEQLKVKLQEAPLYVQNIWTILMNTGMRISEVLKLECDCLQLNKKIEMYEMKFIPSKTQQIREYNELEEFHKIPVNSAVVEAVLNQIELSSELRGLSNSNKIFLCKSNSIITQPKGSTITDNINRIVKKHMIKDANDKLFNYKNKMCRKTLIVELLTKGQTLEATADFIGHLSSETTRKYYAEIKSERIATLDNSMFEKLFEETLDEKIKKQYSFDERKSLINEIKLGVRETPEGHGYCAKHVSFGPCQKKSCVGCKMLITGPQKLPMWYKLYKEQEVYLKDIANEYLNNEVYDYADHRLYQEQVRLLKIYKDTVVNVEAFALKEGIPFEKQPI